MRTTISGAEGGATAGVAYLERTHEFDPELAAVPDDFERQPARRRHWLLDDIPWRDIRHDRVEQSEALFYMIAAASLMESATDLYTENLIEYFAGDDEITSWLINNWLPEELQHGRALRRYVETAWPDFPWDRVREGFVEEFRPFCDESLEAARGLEMASRCVVETGTASFYTCLSRASPEPVLALLTRRIAEDEISHYKHFYLFFRKYRDTEHPRRTEVAQALWRRLRMTGGEDRQIVLKHVHAAHRPGASFDMRTYRGMHHQCRALMRPHFPVEMTIRMLLKPLDLGPRAQRVTLPVLAALTRRLVP